MMSVFNDFSLAWTERFPNSELPNAWEDDVRANLAKHQHKLQLIRLELEKEEFYVQYLERLLADVDKVKIKPIQSDNNGVLETSHNSVGEQCTTSTNKWSDGVISSTTSTANTTTTTTTTTSTITSMHDQYVTVIAVSSYGEIEKPIKSLTDNPLYQSTIVNESNNDSVLPKAASNHNQTEPIKQQVIRKKRPPTPPRKPKLNRFASLELNEKPVHLASVSLPTTPEVDNYMIENNKVKETRINGMKSQLEISENDSKINTQSNVNIVTEDEDNIYDTVAPDEPPVNSNKHNSDVINDNLSTKYYDQQNSYANYVNIDYFLRRDETSSRDSDDNDTHISQSLSSEHETEEMRETDFKTNDHSLTDSEKEIQSLCSANQDSIVTYDEVFENDGTAANNKEFLQRSNELTSQPPKMPNHINIMESERLTMYKCIIASIVESENVYVDCLNTLIQYMKALKSTIGTSHPLLNSEELAAIFYKIPELYSIHRSFLEGLQKLTHNNNNSDKDLKICSIGELFKVLASRLGAYSSFLKNYSKALETVNKCSSSNNQFQEITRSIKISSLKGQSTSLEELLHKPVARVQKNALVLYDLLKYTSEGNSDFRSLKTALKMTQCFLNDLNIAATEQMFPIQDKTQRRLVKESFIIEQIDGKRKLRHLFLFNDVIVCAKYKASAKQKFTFDLKWYISLNEITVSENEIKDDNSLIRDKESNHDILIIKSKVSNIRDLIAKEEKEKGKLNSKLLEKLKKKRSELEANLVLLLPQLLFSIAHKTGKVYTFWLSSEFERSQWNESIKVLQQSAVNTTEIINANELQAWIETCRKNLNPNLGSFLLRSSKDEDLLFGDLYLTVHQLKGLSREADIFFVIEVDMYGHFFQRAITRVSAQSFEPQFEEEFILDMEGTKTIRILCYEEISEKQKPFFRGKANVELCQTWLNHVYAQQNVPILDCNLTLSLRYVSSQSTIARFPAAKVCGQFGLSVQQVCKKEKSSVPYLISCCIREVERRGMKEVGIYRVSGLSSDVQKLKKTFESNAYEADLLMKEIDINAVTGLLKLYLRELNESLFTNAMYKKYFEAFNLTNQSEKTKRLLTLFSSLCQPNQNIVIILIEHLCKVNEYEELNKMSLHNLATVFGPTLLRPSCSMASQSSSFGTTSTAAVDSFTAGTIDVMAQAGILYFFLRRKASNQPLINTNIESSC